MEEEEIAQRELISWGILDKTKVNEIIPTVNFMVWIYSRKMADVFDGGGYQESEDSDAFEDDLVKGAIATWTIQKVNGKNCAELDTKEHVKIVRSIIGDIDNRLARLSMLKTGSPKPHIYDSETGDYYDPNTGKGSKDLLKKWEATRKENDN